MIQSPAALPRHIKWVVEESSTDDAGTRYAHVTVEFRWWYRPIAWFNRLRSRPIAWGPADIWGPDAGGYVLARVGDVLAALPEDADMDAIVRAMRPNSNTIAAGLIALFLSLDESAEEIVARFKKAHERASHAPER